MEEKNYYDWLEVSPKASAEVIEKAYKALVLKYHPDVYKGDFREAEEIIKKLNEAYNVLSDKEKRAKYDLTLTDNTVSKEDYNRLQQELNNIKQREIYNKSSYQVSVQKVPEYNNHANEINYKRQIEQARKKAYYDAYIQDLKNRGYKIRYKKTFKDYLTIIICIIVIMLIIWILWHIPFIQKWLITLANENFIIKLIIDIIKSIYESLFETFTLD